MSSGAIFAQMGACEGQIAEVKAEIEKLRIKMEEQDAAVRSYASKLGDLQAETQDKAGKYANAASHEARAVASLRFRDSVQEKFGGEKPSMEGAAVQIEEGMKRELAHNQELLEMKETHQQNLQTQLNSLQAEYQAALAREEAERQANLNMNSGRR